MYKERLDLGFNRTKSVGMLPVAGEENKQVTINQ